MTLIGEILRKVTSLESVGSNRKYPSPPPESQTKRARGKKRFDKFSHVKPKVDCSPPRLDPLPLWRHLVEARKISTDHQNENIKLIMAIRRIYFEGGKVDSRWKVPPPGSQQYYHSRVNSNKRVEKENKYMYRLITKAQPRVVTTQQHNLNWARNRREIINKALNKFVLFPVEEITDVVEDPAFVSPTGVTRPRVRLHLSLEGGSRLGSLRIELFTDVCPRTCALFMELLEGHTGFGYKGTRFFRKVPHLYWSGGDVTRDNGFGCYAQRGRRQPIGAENYHFSHSMPGLLSMRVTADDEVCGIFNITFKPLPQLDLRNVVFGRVIRPSSTYSAMEGLGAPLSPRPVVILAGASLN